MATNILMPALSPTMTEGKLSRWLKKEGEEVKSGDVLAEIETDKATMEVEAVDEGVLGKIVVPDGTENVAVNAVIGIMTDAGETVPDAKAPEAKAPPRDTSTETQSSRRRKRRLRLLRKRRLPRMSMRTDFRLASGAADGQTGRDRSCDIERLRPNGRIVKADIDGAGTAKAPTAAPKAETAAAPAAAPAPKPAAPPPAVNAPHKAIKNSSMRKVIAKRLSESKQTVPHFYLVSHVEIDALLKLRADLNAKSAKDGPGAFKLSVNDLVIKACAVALRRHPNVNASWTDEAILQYDDVDISIAVAIPDGLITPIIRKADQLGLAAISNAMKDLGARAKSGKLKPDEYQGGGFSISNLGMFGIPEFSAIINPPQSAILAVGAGEKRAVVKGDAIAIATMMTVTLSCDHRVVDGALGAEFLATLKTIVEDPLSLML